MRKQLAEKLLSEAVAVHAAGKKIAFDPNFRSQANTPEYFATFHAIVSIANFIKVSDDDLLGIFPNLTLTEALAELRQFAPAAQILVTRGAAGMTLFSAEK